MIRQRAVNALAQETLAEQAFRVGSVDAATGQIEQRVLRNGPHGGAVGATDIVSVNFQFGLGVDVCVFTHPQVLVGQLLIGDRSDLVYVDATIECAFASVRHDVVNGLFALAAWLPVL